MAVHKVNLDREFRLMNVEVQRALESFCGPGNGWFSHPSDRRRFFDFIVASYRHGGSHRNELEEALKAEAIGAHPEALREAMRFYEFGIGLLDRFEVQGTKSFAEEWDESVRRYEREGGKS